MPYKINFAQDRLEKEPAPVTGRRCIWDAKTPGLCLYITANGARTLCHVKMARTAAGKWQTQRTKLGRLNQISIADARARAAGLTAQITAGVDPAKERRDSERAAKAQKPFEEAFALYLADRRAKGKRTVDEMERKGELYLSSFKGRPVNEITFEDVRDLHAKIAAGVTFEGKQYGGKGAANRVVELLSAVFNHARRRADNPCAGIELFDETKRRRFLKPDELPAFMTAVKAEPPTLRDFFLMALWTGQRRANVQAMRWDEIDEAAGTWTIKAAKFKTNRDHTVPLPPEAIGILAERRELNATRETPSEYVFPSHRSIGKGKSPHLTEPKTAWRRILKQAKLSDLRVHDLRHTLASWMVAGGAALSTIGKSLGHTQVQTTARYAHVQLDPVREAMAAATAAMAAASEAQATPAKATKPAKPKRQK